MLRGKVLERLKLKRDIMFHVQQHCGNLKQGVSPLFTDNWQKVLERVNLTNTYLIPQEKVYPQSLV